MNSNRHIEPSGEDLPPLEVRNSLLLQSNFFFQVPTLGESIFCKVEEHAPIVIHPPPEDFPKECRYRGCFIPIEVKEPPVNTNAQPSHKGYYATYNGKIYYVKLNNLDPTIPDSDKLPELEAAAWISYQIVEPLIVPGHTFPLYDYDEKTDKCTLVAVASELLPGFEPNRDNSLKTSDLIIHILDADSGYQRGHLLGLMNQLSDNLSRNCETSFKWFKETFNSITSTISYSWNPKKVRPAASKVKSVLDDLITKSKKELIPTNEISHLASLLNNRHLYLTNELRNKLRAQLEAKYIDEKTFNEQFVRYSHEDPLLKETIVCANNFVNLQLNETKTDILKLELLDREIRKKSLDIENIDIFKDPKQKIPGFDITIGDIRNYRTIKIQAKSTCLSYYRYENDNHNKNNGKKGRVDFDMSLWGFLHKFKNLNYFDWFKETSKSALPTFIKDLFGIKDTFTYTVGDMEIFPNIKAPLRYWPTFASPIDASSKVGLAPFYENLYSTDDVIPFQRLAFHPVFDFHKWKTFLKCALVTDEMHRTSAEMMIRNNVPFTDVDDQKKKILLDEFVAHEKKQAQDFTNVLVRCPSFKVFLEQYNYVVPNAQGESSIQNHIFDLIKEEFKEEQIALYQQEVKDGNKHYQPLVDAIDFKKMEKQFEAISTAVLTPQANNTPKLN